MNTRLLKTSIAQTDVRYGKRTHEHAQVDKESSVYKNSQVNNLHVTHEDFQILEKGLPKFLMRRIAQYLYVKEHLPRLNKQKDTILSSLTS